MPILFKDTFIAPKNRLTRFIPLPQRFAPYNCINPTMSYTVETTSLNAVSYVVTIIGIRDLTGIKQTVSTDGKSSICISFPAIDTDHDGSDFSGQIFAWNITGDDRVEREREKERERERERGTTVSENFSGYSINLHLRYVVKRETGTRIGHFISLKDHFKIFIRA